MRRPPSRPPIEGTREKASNEPVANQGVGRTFTIPLRSHGAWSSRLQSAHPQTESSSFRWA